MNVTFSKMAAAILQSEFPFLETTGFRKAMKAYLADFLKDYFEAEGDPDFENIKKELIHNAIQEIMDDINIVPDVYAFLPDQAEIIIYEIEDTHPLTIEKMHKLSRCWACLEEYEINLRLIVTDRYAQNRRELDLEMYDHLLAVMPNVPG